MIAVGLVPGNLNPGNEEAWAKELEYFEPSQETEAYLYAEQLQEKAELSCDRVWMGESRF